ncbi:polyamine-modulated factor 1-binding protein 1-like [Sycon ciliatum]|uniref:polyamine-modulated factor 1-binding protein 1-like n=1 Tax=Sycon ciliatum TaxID=27933 RepID=UPI0031F70718
MSEKSSLEDTLSKEKAAVERVRDELKTLEKDTEVVKRHNKHFQQKLEKAEIAEEELTTQLTAVQPALQEAEEQKIRMQKKLDSTSRKFDQLKDLFQQLNTEREKISDQFVSLTEEQEGWKKKVEQQQATIGNLQSSLQHEQQASTGLAEEKQRMLVDLTNYQQGLSALRSEHQNLLSVYQQIGDSEKSLMARLGVLNGHVAEQQARANHWATEHKKLNEESLKMRQRLDSLVRQNTIITEERDDYQRNWVKASSSLDGMAHDLKHIKEERDALQANLQRQISDLTAETAALDENSKHTGTKLKSLIDHRDLLLSELEACRAQAQAHREDYEEENRSKERIRLENVRMSREKDTLAHDCEHLRKQTNQLLAEVEELKNEQRIAQMRRRVLHEAPGGSGGSASASGSGAGNPQTIGGAAAATSHRHASGLPYQQQLSSDDYVPPPAQHRPLATGRGAEASPTSRSTSHTGGEGAHTAYSSPAGTWTHGDFHSNPVSLPTHSHGAEASAGAQRAAGLAASSSRQLSASSDSAAAAPAVSQLPQPQLQHKHQQQQRHVPLDEPTQDGRFYRNILPTDSPEFTCPKCGSDYPDLNTLQIHVLDCIR